MVTSIRRLRGLRDSFSEYLATKPYTQDILRNQAGHHEEKKFFRDQLASNEPKAKGRGANFYSKHSGISVQSQPQSNYNSNETNNSASLERKIEEQRARRERLVARGRLFGPRPEWVVFPEEAKIKGRTFKFFNHGLFRRTKANEVLVRSTEGEWWLWLPEEKIFKSSPGKFIARKGNIAAFWIKRRTNAEKKAVRHLIKFPKWRKKPDLCQ
eukprot:TRINITY_DN5312_c0_g1_i1.p1 TRINITY_DN5312_c0_g1~~TRINITY_DN5312_c0_g1_i1.p1  ORF type:complete len:212 (+),score=18.21 TRINITY_DN5312_c0_g1_i1:177-812(+)